MGVTICGRAGETVATSAAAEIKSNLPKVKVRQDMVHLFPDPAIDAARHTPVYTLLPFLLPGGGILLVRATYSDKYSGSPSRCRNPNCWSRYIPYKVRMNPL